MSIKIRVSYETVEELSEIIAAFGDWGITKCKVPENQKGKYKKAYIDLKRKRPYKT